ncbi:MAG: hypothetical protein IPK68_21595 [Bdellovibrionales bacterium]|nr:hypothetical protein [Bdellovibrionales bacterium]
MKLIAIEIILLFFFMSALHTTTDSAIAGPGDNWIESQRIELIPEKKEKKGSTCLKRLTGPTGDQPLVVAEPTQPDKATSLRTLKRPDVPTPSGYLKSWEELDRFIDSNELGFWVEEGKKLNGDVRGTPDHFVRLISDYRDSVKDILLQKNLKEGQILKVLYYNISSVSSGLIPEAWSRSSSELNYFLTDQLELLRYLLAEEIVHNYETLGGRIRKIVNRHLFGLFPSATKKILFNYEAVEKIPGRDLSIAKDFVNNFESIISPLLHPRFGVRIVFQTCQLLYDLMLDQKYFQVAKKKSDLTLHRLLQDTLLRTGTHPYVLLHFWAKEPRLLMDQDFPADGFWFRRSGVLKNLPQSKRRLKSLTESDAVRTSRQNNFKIFEWKKYDDFDPNLVLSFGSDAKYEEIQPQVGPAYNFLVSLKSSLESVIAGRFSEMFRKTGTHSYLELDSTGPWSSSLSGHSATLNLFLLQAARDERLLKFGLRISTSISAEDQEFLDYVTSRNSDSISRIARNLNEQRRPSGARGPMRRFSEFFSRSFSLLILGPVDSQEVEPLLLENGRADYLENASNPLYKTPALPALGVAIALDTSPPGDDASPQVQVQKLGTTYKQLAQEIESIYGWVMNVESGVGNIIDYTRSWPEITSMINPDHLDEMINRLTYNLDVLVDIQNRMPSLDEVSQAEEALAIKKITRTFAESSLSNLIQFTRLLLGYLKVIQHAMNVHHPSSLGHVSSDNLTVLEEMSRVSRSLRILPRLLQQRHSTSEELR